MIQLMLGVCVAPSAGHPALPTTALIRVNAARRVDCLLRFDIIAFALNDSGLRISDDAMNRLLDGPRDDLRAALQDARERFVSLFELRADGERVALEIDEFPALEAVEAWKRSGIQPRLPVKLDVKAHAAFGSAARMFAVRFPEVMGSVIITVERPGVEPVGLPLNAGEVSPELEIKPVRAGGVATGSDAEAPAAVPPAGHAAEREPMSAARVAGRYIGLGFTHILPLGLDHVLFVLGLFLLSSSLKSLLWQITAFTVAHTITLALAVLGVIHLAPAVVEPLIAASIAFVAIENLCTTKLHAWRPVVVFLFGLVHGTGFAGALSELGLPRGRLAEALVSFNVGVELGQLAVIAMAFALVGWWRKRVWYRGWIAVPASVMIAGVGLFWTVQRIFWA